MSVTSAAPRAIAPDYDIDRLVGRYRLTVVTTANARADTIARGTLVLQRTTLVFEDSIPWRRAFPLWGSADLDFERLGLGRLPHSPKSRDQRQPGVQVTMVEPGHLNMRIGNTIGLYEDGSITKVTDRGLLFDAFTANDLSIVGRWHASSAGSGNPEGYFCAYRVK